MKIILQSWKPPFWESDLSVSILKLNYCKWVFFYHPYDLLAWEILLLTKLEIEETYITKYSTFKTDIIKVGLVFSISNFLLIKFLMQINGWGKKYLLAVIQLYTPTKFWQMMVRRPNCVKVTKSQRAFLSHL